ncbi:hypothetical protein CNC03930 [Cryptococcus gattii WM276]|uniref:Zn(2)-C6 fungal-type domain-containing protein n=2 Tax=Cryptococcus gattii TaxID=37769 RepID=E6R1N2_CRYGW|nr:uncharacterized protein CGB_C6040C [Cryptococcus gattii WM276]ADV21200.1 hypothetical protein CNC03930 [Cryptococcus gattii WM276]KIR81955.1 hypothetical protein I306_00949 [Cryptococcus gattii EJB2]KJE04089.1 hypothetical protein I311_02220 [Cryptococcus gattii NT-10]
MDFYPPQLAGQSSTATALEHLGSATQANQQSVTPDIVTIERKRKKRSGNNEEDGTKIKKTRQSQSCDACRARKVKCDRPPPGKETNGPIKNVCSHCAQLNLPCTFDYVQRKRGPPNMYLKRIREDQEVESNENGKSIPSPVGSSKFNSEVPASIARAPPPSQTILRGTLPMMSNNTSPGWQPTLAMTMPTTQSAHAGHYPPSTMSISNSSSPTAQAVTAPLGLSPLRSRSYLPASLDPSHPLVASQTPSAQSSPLHLPQHLAYINHTFNPRNPLDSVLPRPLLYHIIDLYFDYIYCLIPCLHKPSFVHDLNTKREENLNEEEWVILVLAVVASTLVQLPRSFVNLPRKEVKDLVLRCHNRVRNYLAQDFDSVTVTRTIIIYLSLFVYRIIGRIAVAEGLFGQNYVAILTLRAHEERTYAKLGNIERVLLRRMFWLMYGADKTLAFTGAFPAFFHEDDCASVALPEDIDDEYLTKEGYIKQPESYTSVLSGFRYISDLFRVSGEVLDKRRRDRLRSPSGLMLQMRINEINELHNRTMSIMDLCPAPLKLDYRSASVSVMSMSPDWDERIKSDIHTIFSDPNKHDMDLVKDFYLVQQANIYITQQLVRFTIIQYREELLESQQDDVHHELDLAQRETMKRSIREQAQDERDEVVVDMLSILQKIPIQVLAVNSFSIIEKVRFVASSLLDFLNHDEGIGLLPPSSQETRAQKAQRNLWKFLNYLFEIESMYSWDDDKATI